MHEQPPSIRPKSAIPNTSSDHIPNADLAHERTLEKFVDKTELGVVDEEQQAIEALLAATKEIGLELPGTTRFFVRQRELSSGVKGIGRVQVKEVITAGAFPMSLLFGDEKPGLLDKIKSIISFGKSSKSQEGSK
jgi:hypothetical protein